MRRAEHEAHTQVTPTEETSMIAIIPLITGIALGITAPRRTAVIAQAVLFVLAAAVLVATAPDHDSTRAQGGLLALGLLPLAALSLGAGLLIRRRRSTAPTAR
jgi:drug/metabolite transporter (DMT)-like permease